MSDSSEPDHQDNYSGEDDDEELMLPDFSNIPNTFNPPNLYVGQLQTIVNNVNETLSLIDKCMLGIGDAAVEAEECQLNDQVFRLDTVFLRMLDQKHIVKYNQDQFQKSKDIIMNKDGSELQGSLSSAINNQVMDKVRIYQERSSKQKYQNNEDYNIFRQRIWEINNPDSVPPPLTFPDSATQVEQGDNTGSDDDDLIVAQQRIPIKCPITTLYYVDPVTNPGCKHTYSSEAIKNYIRARGNSAPCPISGCSKIIKMNQLKKDSRVAKMVERTLTRRQLQADDEEAGESQQLANVTFL